MSVELLDCTLRDGGHINNSNFGKFTISSIINNLVKTNVDIIEIGFLRNGVYQEDYSVFPDMSCVKRVLPNIKKCKYALMLQEDQYDWKNLEQNDGTIDYIRVSFHNYDFQQGIDCCKEVIKKGYKCFVNPINLPGYSDKEIIDIVSVVNEVHPYAFTIVDTFGVMKKNDLVRMYQIIENNLDKDIIVAIHLHENLSLAYSLAQSFVEMTAPMRSIIIDGSLYGMGRVPGNLCIELMMDYLNETRGNKYNNEYAFDAIDDFISPIKKKNPWGYSSAYALSAQFFMHRSYAEYLLKKDRLKTKDIKRILESIDEKDRTVYKEKIVEQKYKEYIENKIDDIETIKELKDEISKYKNVLVVSPGSSLMKYKERINQFIQYKKTCIISVNFIPEELKVQLVFFGNAKRYYCNEISMNCKTIISSNIVQKQPKAKYIVDYRSLTKFEDKSTENSTLMLFTLLYRIGVNKIYCAGFDGFGKTDNFCIPFYERDFDYEKENVSVQNILMEMDSKINIITLTPSIYKGLEMFDEKNYYL